MRPPTRTSCSSSSSRSSEEEEINIFLKVIKTVALNVKRSETIKNLKTILREKEGISEYFQELYFTGERLKDDYKLLDCGIQRNSTLHLVLQNLGIIKIFVSIPSKKKTIEVEAKVHDTIHNIKSLIQVREGICSDQYTLLYAGILLEDCSTLASLGINRESTLHLIFDPKDVLSISVKMATGEIVKTEVKLLYTVDDVKAIVGSIAGVPVGDQSLIYAGKKLEDSKTLSSYNIIAESILEMRLPTIQIFVKHWNGKTITVDVCQQDTVTDVKKNAFHKLGMPNDYGFHYLMFAGKRLQGDRNLASYGIGKNSTLYVVCRLGTLVQPMKLSDIDSFTPNLLGTTTIHILKQIIRTKMRKPVKEVLLCGQALLDQLSLADYAIKPDTVICVAF